MTLYMGTIVSWGDSILKVKVQFSSQIYWPTWSHYRRQCTCSLADGHRHFMETCCLHLQGEVYAKTNAACSSKIYQTACCHMTEYCNFYIGYLLVKYYNFPGTAILLSHKLHYITITMVSDFFWANNERGRTVSLASLVVTELNTNEMTTRSINA